MSDTSYQWTAALQHALKRNRRDAHNRYLQLATVRRDGTPAVRTLVFRELCSESMQLRMITDRRSDKVDDILAHAAGEICWYFTHTREQFRFRGSLALTGPEADDQSLRGTLWASLSDAAREQFFWPDPGTPVADDSPVYPRVREGDTAPDSFMVLALLVETVDHLCLRGSPQTRWRSFRDDSGGWQSEAINP
ncbi:MAG: pyridoxamine 5'-phosphate oxidase family protein [Pseudomonadota bacterium]